MWIEKGAQLLQMKAIQWWARRGRNRTRFFSLSIRLQVRSYGCGGSYNFNGFLDNTSSRNVKKPSTLYSEYSRKPKSDIEKNRG
jgi:hypothetical protein